MNTYDLYDHTNRSHARAHEPAGIEVAQWAWELEALAQLHKISVPSITVELGVFKGGTLWHWLKGAPRRSLVIGIDQNPVQPIWDTWAESSFARLEYLKGNTHEPTTREALIRLLDGREIDFLFIDSDHTEEGVTQDWEMYGDLVRPGGLVAFHDILDPAPSRNQDHIRVSRLWRKLQAAGYRTQELIAHPGQDWGGIGVLWK